MSLAALLIAVLVFCCFRLLYILTLQNENDDQVIKVLQLNVLIQLPYKRLNTIGYFEAHLHISPQEAALHAQLHPPQPVRDLHAQKSRCVHQRFSVVCRQKHGPLHSVHSKAGAS